LERMHVLVTRTGAEGQTLVRTLDDLGLDALHLPLVRLRGIGNPDQVRERFASLPPVDGLILTSREGVRQAAALGLLESQKCTLTVVPGPGTRSLAHEMGLRRACCPDPRASNSEGMLAMDEMRRVTGMHWLILGAVDGRRLLDRTLEARGADVRRLTVYERCPEPPSEVAIERLHAARNWITLLASGAALDRLVNCLPGPLWEKLRLGTMLVPSERLRARAIDCGVSKTVVCDGAGDQAMLDALKASTSGR